MVLARTGGAAYPLVTFIEISALPVPRNAGCIPGDLSIILLYIIPMNLD
jgi:hypothetical protein